MNAKETYWNPAKTLVVAAKRVRPLHWNNVSFFSIINTVFVHNQYYMIYREIKMQFMYWSWKYSLGMEQVLVNIKWIIGWYSWAFYGAVCLWFSIATLIVFLWQWFILHPVQKIELCNTSGQSLADAPLIYCNISEKRWMSPVVLRIYARFLVYVLQEHQL